MSKGARREEIPASTYFMDISDLCILGDLITEQMREQKKAGAFSDAALELHIEQNALSGGRLPALTLELRNPCFTTITAYSPIDEDSYISALSNAGMARFNLANMYSSRSAIVTGGVEKIGDRHYLCATIDTPYYGDAPGMLRAVLYRAVDTLAGYLHMQKTAEGVNTDEI